MCLIVDVKKTRAFKKQKTDRDYTFYKVFRMSANGKYLKSPYFEFRVTQAGRYTAGPERVKARINSIAASGKVGEKKVIIDKGCFHGYCDDPKAESHFHPNFYQRMFPTTDIIIMPIKVRSKEIVAFGEFEEVCFKSFTVTDDAWDDVFS